MNFFRKKRCIPPRNGGTPPAKLEYAVGAVVEQLVLLEPHPWSSMALALPVVDGVMGVARFDVTLSPGKEELPAYFMDDHAIRIALVGGACARLASTLLRDDEWLLESIHCRRLGELFSLQLKGKKNCRAFSDIPMQGLLYTPHTDEELRSLAPHIKRVNQELKTLVGTHRDKQWDQKESPNQISFTMSDTESLILPAAFLGSYSETLHSWCWGWANSSLSPHTTTTIQDFHKHLPKEGAKPIFLRGDFPATLPFCWTVAHLAAQGLGNHPVFAWPVQNGRLCLFFALDIKATGFKTGS